MEDRAAWIERRYGVRVRVVSGLEERALVLDNRALVLVDEGLRVDEWESLLSLLASRDPHGGAWGRQVDHPPRRGGGEPRP